MSKRAAPIPRDVVIEARRRADAGEKYVRLAEEYGVNPRSLQKRCRELDLTPGKSTEEIECMCCHEIFPSENIKTNRMCNQCRQLREYEEYEIRW